MEQKQFDSCQQVLLSRDFFLIIIIMLFGKIASGKREDNLTLTLGQYFNLLSELNT